MQGRDKEVPWVLWIESGEIHGGAAGGFLLLRRAANKRLDDRCVRLGDTSVSVPIPLRLGMSKAQLRTRLGSPTAVSGTTRVYFHRRVVMLRSQAEPTLQPFDLCSALYVRLGGNMVDGFEVWRTTTS